MSQQKMLTFIKTTFHTTYQKYVTQSYTGDLKMSNNNAQSQLHNRRTFSNQIEISFANFNAKRTKQMQ